MTSTSTRDLVSQPYKYGFVTEIETDKIAKGLSEAVSYTHLTLPTT